MKQQAFIELLFKRAEGLLTPQESEKLDAWLEASADHRANETMVAEILAKAAAVSPEINLDLDAEYKKLSERIKVSEPSVKPMGGIWWLGRIAAGFALLILTIWFITRSGSPEDVVITDAIEGVELSDKSKIWLTPGSVATFNDGGERRDLQLEGVAYFEIAKDDQRTFSIHTAAGTIEVVGTKFEVDAATPTTLRVKVSEGIVKVFNQSRSDSITLSANEALVIQDQTISKLDAEVVPIATWRLQPILFSKKPLREILLEIERLYSVKFQVENPDVLNCEITFTLSYPPMPVLIQTLETLLSIKIVDQGDGEYFVSGSGC